LRKKNIDLSSIKYGIVKGINTNGNHYEIIFVFVV
jgi:hypothetical protein